MPVIDGRPTAADIDNVARMVSHPTVLPGDDQPWLYGYNRGGQWTIDAAGRYVRFPGREVGDPRLSFIHEASTGRVLTATRNELLVLRPGQGFAPIANVSDKAGYGFISLLRVERLDLTLVMTRSTVQRLKGEALEPWPESAHVVGDGGIGALDLPALHAVLFLPADGTLKLRYDDGRWVTLGRRDHAGRDYWIERVSQTATASTALIWMRETRGPLYRLLGLFSEGRDGPVHLIDAGPYDRYQEHDGPQIVYAAATGEILKFEPSSPQRRPSWSRLTPTGYAQIPGGLAPRQYAEGLRLAPVALSRDHAMVFETDKGLAIYKQGRMRLIPGPAPAGLGEFPDVVDLAAIGRTLIVSRQGLFELTPDKRIVPAPAPFSTGGLPALRIFEDAKRNLAIIHAVEGLFTLDRRGVYRRIASPPLAAPLPDEHVVTLAVSGDHLLTLNNALWLLTSPASPRWARCQAERGSAPG